MGIRFAALIVIIAVPLLRNEAMCAQGSNSPALTQGNAQIAAKLSTAPVFAAGSNADLLTAILTAVNGATSPLCTPSNGTTAIRDCAEMAKSEVLRRRPVQELMKALRDGSFVSYKPMLAMELLEGIGGPDVTSPLARLARHYDGSLANYLALMHFARSCSPWALHTLNDHWWQFGLPSFVWAEAIEQFGRCNYRPATANLIQSLDAMSANAADAAYNSLKLMYPTGPGMAGDEEAVRSWKAWIRLHGDK